MNFKFLLLFQGLVNEKMRTNNKGSLRSK